MSNSQVELQREAVWRPCQAVLEKLRERLAGAVTLDMVRVRPRTVTVEGFTLGNPPTADFASPFLVSMRVVRVECNPLSLAGVRGRGNFVMGWLAGEIRLMAARPSHHNFSTCT